ncbi:DUF475 domain-containing protein [Kitasatospora sp. YST-16]|uniref:DUF475 domain-containing protein n=1 Tax=unclassified Kitasatospora TaxID=2633591 RepID=UPI0004C2BC2D|nr:MULTISPECIES: DUF475 domain-containing protein [unclassified Kitasatospora]WAL71668.1 DUF475 domain-containing protein [Kitasatospora sp. YST-16]WNW37709.1 DUF475 domain-containing protein [Streptomyces sp. Li-HN-5-13]
MFLRTFGWSFAITIAGLIAAGLIWGAEGFGVVLILSILEISLSFDNAVVNATVLKRMNAFWQKIFLTVGVLIAVFGMRLVFPLLVVGLTAQLSPGTVIELALDSSKTHDGHTYAEYLDMANPAIAAFGGIFLLMIFLDFVFEEKDFNWLRWLEKPLEKIGKLDALSSVVALVVLAVSSRLFAGDRAETVLLAGVCGLATYLAVNGLSGVFESGLEAQEEAEEEAERTGKSIVQVGGKAAFFLFIYLEVLDASFSFDGVVGAFAISQDIFQITLGLGIGAMYIRSLTVFLVRKGTLDDYVYLEHGAHYAIGALALILLASIKYHVPEIVTGLIGVAFIGAALASSMIRNKRHQGLEGSGAEPEEVGAEG